MAQKSAELSLNEDSLDLGIDYNENMDIYWDALDVSEEASMRILPANSDFTHFTMNSTRSNKHKRDDNAWDFDEQDVKAMRFGSLDRIMEYTAKANNISDKSLIKVDPSVIRDDQRKALTNKIFRCINAGDMNSLSKLIVDNFSDALAMNYYHIPETIYGKAEAMMLFALECEAYPNGVWKILTTEIQGNSVVYQYMFTGTSVFNIPISSSYQNVKKFVNGTKVENNLEAHHSKEIAQKVFEFIPMQKLDSGAGIAAKVPLINPSGPVLGEEPVQQDSAAVQVDNDDDEDDESSDEENTISLSRSKTTKSSIIDSSLQRVVSSTNASAQHLNATLKPMAEKPLVQFPNLQLLTNPLAPSDTIIIRADSSNAEMLANAMLQKSVIKEKRRCEITFNDYNLVTQINISPI